MDDLGIGRKGVELAGGAVVETRAQGDQQVGFLHGDIGGARAVHPQHAKRQLMRRRQGAQALQGRNGRDTGARNQVAQLLRGITHFDAAADIEQGFLRRFDELFRGLDGAGVGGRRRPGREAGCMRSGDSRRGDILGDVDQDGAGATFLGNCKGFGQDRRDLGRVADQPRMLDDRQGDAEDIDFLEAIRAHQVRTDLAGDADQRDGIHIGIGNAGDQVGGAGARRGHADTDAAGGTCIGIGGKGGALFVTDEDVLQAGSGERIVDRHDGAARIAEQGFDPQRLQRGDDQLRAGGLIAHQGSRNSAEIFRKRGGGDAYLHHRRVVGYASTFCLFCSQLMRPRRSLPTTSIWCSRSWRIRAL